MYLQQMQSEISQVCIIEHKTSNDVFLGMVREY
jgi:hypothetical protein